ncbi:MAG: type II toxin-antitoxin system PemK/MazF family toxin [Flavobacteriales bacterium]|nr:type II toxin-antitoxin system PemK/MazF family toxin [Flavobacteriales bacterium]
MVERYGIYWINLDPTIGKEMKKTLPCIVLSPNEANRHMSTAVIAPITSTLRNYPMRLSLTLKGKKGQIACDQLRCVDLGRIGKKIQLLPSNQQKKLRELLQEYLVAK